MKGLGASADNTDKSFGKLKATVIAVAAVLQVRVVAKYADAFTSLQNQIRQTTRTTEQLTNRTQQLLEVANRSRSGFTETADLFTQLTLATENLGISTEQQIRLTETISKSFAVSGKSAAESAGAIRQLGQAFSSGALRGDEFNSIAEGAPELMRALQRSLRLTAGELRKFAATGGITAEIMVKAFGEAAGVIDEKMINAVQTLAQSMVIAENNAIAFVGASDLITTSMGKAGESIVFLSENLDTIANVLLVAALTGFSRLTVGIIISTVESVKNTIAQRANAIAALESAKAQQVAALAFFRSAQGATKGSIATKQLSVANIALAAASKTAALQTTVLSRAMGLLGGPLGIILTVASAIVIYSTSASDAKTPTQQLAEEVDKLSKSFSGLSDQARFAATANNVAKIMALNKDLEVTVRSLAASFGVSADDTIPAGTRAIINQNQSVKDLLGSIRKLEVANEALFKVGIDKALVGATDQTGLTGIAKPVKEDDPFINNERFKTSSLRAQLNERLAIQRAFNETALSEFATIADQERSISEFNRMADLAVLETRKTDAALDFEQRREALLVNDKLTSEARLALGVELELQEIDQKRIFELEKTDRERVAAEERENIARAEAEGKRAILAESATIILGAIGTLGEKSIKIQKAVSLAQSGIAIATGIARAQELGFPANLVEIARVVAVGAKVFSTIRGTSIGSVSTVSGTGGGGGTSAAPPAARQEPISQSNVLEFRGLSEVAAELANLDPGDVIPVEFAQRIVAGITEFERFSGAGG